MTVEDSPVVARSVVVWVEELYRAHVTGVYNVAYRVLWNRGDAEDVVQATFVKAVLRVGQLTDPAKVRAWLLQVAYREAIATLRRRRDLPTDPTKMPSEPANSKGPAELAVATAVAEVLSSALHKLASDERLAVVLRDVEGLSMREVAEVTGIGLSAAKMRVHRGRQSLRVLLENLEVR